MDEGECENLGLKRGETANAKTPKEESAWHFLRNSEKAGMTREEWARKKVTEDEMRELDKSRILEAVIGSVGFIPNVIGDC